MPITSIIRSRGGTREREVGRIRKREREIDVVHRELMAAWK